MILDNSLILKMMINVNYIMNLIIFEIMFNSSTFIYFSQIFI